MIRFAILIFDEISRIVIWIDEFEKIFSEILVKLFFFVSREKKKKVSVFELESSNESNDFSLRVEESTIRFINLDEIMIFSRRAI